MTASSLSRRVRRIFVVNLELSEVLKPCERYFYNPLYRQHQEFCRTFVRKNDDLRSPFELYEYSVSRLVITCLTK